MKILAIANAHALAHVSRLLEIAKVLRERGHDILFAGHGKYLQVATWDGFATQELPYISVAQVVSAIRSQKLWQLYPETQLRSFIEAELGLIETFRPDVILLDNRITARTSAEKAGIRTAAVLNVHMSNHKRIPFMSASNVLGDWPLVRQIDAVENRIECAVYDKLVMGGLNRIRRQLSLKPLFAYEHEEAELSFFADIPEFSPVQRLPAHARYIGPLTWHNTLPAPACLNQLRPGQPTVYFSLGSEGLEDLLPHLAQLAGEGIQVIVATGAATLAQDLKVPEGVFLEPYINTERVLPLCHVVCCHGGNGTIYQALSFGLPIVVVATHEEQYYGGKRVQQLELGRAFRLKMINKHGPQLIVQALREVLEDPGYGQRAQSFANYLKPWQGAEMAAAAIEAVSD